MADVSHLAVDRRALWKNRGLWLRLMTTTTHKSLRGPRGGMILCKKQHAAAIDSRIPACKAAAYAPNRRDCDDDEAGAKRGVQGYASRFWQCASSGAALLAGGAHLVRGTETSIVSTRRPASVSPRYRRKSFRQSWHHLNKNVIPDDQPR